MAKRIIDHYDLIKRGKDYPFAPLGIMGIDGFIEDLVRLYNYPNPKETNVLNDDRLTLEGVMNHFYLKQHLLRHPPFFHGMLDPSIRILNDLLAYTLAESLSGPPCDKHAKLAGMMKRGDVIFNFNYDILMDNALYDSAKLTDFGYIIRSDYTFADGNWRRAEDVRSDVYMFKLHGSLNWLRCNRCGRNLLLRYQKNVSPLWMQIKELPLTCPGCNATKMELQRILIPPAGLKNFSDNDVAYLWGCATDYCKQIKRIVVIGYRFSDMDYELEMLLREMVFRGGIKDDVPIVVVNPPGDSRDALMKRLTSIFVKSGIEPYDSLDIFLDGNN